MQRPTTDARDLFAADPIVEAYKRDVDIASLRENLKRSVEERIAALASLQRLALEARRAGELLARHPTGRA